MIDQLRAFLNRPLADGDRPRMFLIAATVILAAAGVLALLSDSRPTQSPRKPPASATDARVPTDPPMPSQPAAIDAPSEEGKPREALKASRADVAQAKRAARRFLGVYLAYTYGRRDARDLPASSTALRERLRRQRPRVPARERRRRPRPLLVQANGVGRVRAAVVALVDDGSRRYTVALELARVKSGWQVTDIGS